MPVLRKADLLAIKKQYNEYKQLSNRSLEQLYFEMQPKEEEEIGEEEPKYNYKDLNKDYAICAAILNSELSYTTLDLYNIMERKYNITFDQLDFITENRNHLEEHSTITHDGESVFLTEDNNAILQAKQKLNSEPVNKEEDTFDYDGRCDRDDIFQDAMKNSSKEDNVYFNYIFFNDILDNKTRAIDSYLDKEYEPRNSLGLGRDLLDDIEEDRDSSAEIRADGKIKAYITLNESSKKSFLEKLKHPIQSIYELYAKNKIAKELKNEFGLNKETLNTISDKIMSDEHPTENGKPIFDKNFICFDKNNKMITMDTSLEDCTKAANAMFPAAKEEPSLDNLANDTLTENVNLNKSQKVIANERQVNRNIEKE